MIKQYADIPACEEPEEKGEVDMCKAMEDYTIKIEVLGAIKTMNYLGFAPDKIVEQVSALFNTSKEYVENLMNPIPA